MSVNKLEISIIKDSGKLDANLDAMSLEVAEAFLVLVESLTKIVQNSPNKATLKIKVSSGSVKVAIEGTGITGIRNDYLQVVNYQTYDRAIIQPWRMLQSLIQKNSIGYASEMIVDDQRTIIHQVLRESKPFRIKKRPKPAIKTLIEFITGQLYQVGGKKSTNIHILKEDQETVIIDCTPEQADSAKQFLYKDALISTWLIPGNDKNTHVLCSSYYYDDLALYNKLRQFINDFENAADEIDSLEKLHMECRYYLDNKDYVGFKYFLNLFNHNSFNISVLHTILMLTTSFEQNQILKEILEKLNILFETKLKSLNRNPKRAIEKTN